jgi:hypothetical protein
MRRKFWLLSSVEKRLWQQNSRQPSTNSNEYGRERKIWTETEKDEEQMCKGKSVSELSVWVRVVFFLLLFYFLCMYVMFLL